jgi:ferredoxin
MLLLLGHARPARRGRAALRHSAVRPHMCAGERESLVDAMWQSTTATGPNPNTEDPSHEHLELDEETGEPVQARFTFVDEHTCIGCTYCSTVARNTFFMQDDHGRARVYDQGGDSEDLVLEAIDSCPVNCIHFVSFEDLVILETERSGQRINNAARLVSQQEGTAAVPPSQARNYQSGVMRCNNCPSRGCKDCPMFGVGENPIFLARRAERLELREARGDTQREAERQQREVARG